MHSARSLSLLAGAVLAGAVGLTGCSSEASDDRTVAAAFYPLAWAAEQVAGEHYDVTDLTSTGAPPHDMELSIKQTATLSGAALVIHEQGVQPAVDAAVEQNAEGAVLDAAEVVELKALGESDHEHESSSGSDHDHDHGDLDPHFWQDPARMADLGDAIGDELAELDPEHAADYRSNAADLRADLGALDQEYADGLRDCERDTVVVSHDAFGYLDKYGLDLHPIMGLAPDAEPSAATLSELRRVIADDGVTTVFSETLSSAKSAESLARTAGVETAVLDPVEGLSDDTADEDYLSLMRANLTALQEANGC